MKAVLVAHDFPPFGGGAVMRVVSFAKYLGEFGWDVTVVTAHTAAYHPAWLDPELARKVAGIRIVRCWYPHRFLVVNRAKTSLQNPTSGQTTWSEARLSPIARLRRLAKNLLIPDQTIGWVWPAYRAVRRLFQAGECDVVFTTIPVHSTSLVGLLAKRLLGIPWVLDIRDQWSGNVLYRVGPWRWRIERRLERACLDSADAVVVVTGPVGEYYRSLAPHGPVEVILNGYDPDDFAGRAAAFPERFTVAYVGSIGPTRDPTRFVAAWREFLATRGIDPARAELRFIGPISGVPIPAQVAADPLLAASCTIRAFVPHDEALDEMANASVLVLFTSEREGGESAYAGKVFEYIAARKPILAVAPPGAVTELVRGRGLGLACPMGDRDGLVAALEALYDRHVAGTLATMVPAGAGADFDRKQLCEQLAKVLDRAASRLA